MQTGEKQTDFEKRSRHSKPFGIVQNETFLKQDPYVEETNKRNTQPALRLIEPLIEEIYSN